MNNPSCELGTNDPILQMGKLRLRGHVRKMSFWDLNLDLLSCSASLVSTVVSPDLQEGGETTSRVGWVPSCAPFLGDMP